MGPQDTRAGRAASVEPSPPSQREFRWQRRPKAPHRTAPDEPISLRVLRVAGEQCVRDCWIVGEGCLDLKRRNCPRQHPEWVICTERGSRTTSTTRRTTRSERCLNADEGFAAAISESPSARSTVRTISQGQHLRRVLAGRLHKREPPRLAAYPDQLEPIWPTIRAMLADRHSWRWPMPFDHSSPSCGHQACDSCVQASPVYQLDRCCEHSDAHRQCAHSASFARAGVTESEAISL